MTESSRPHNDRPIAEPAEDRFGIDPFAQALASSIRNIKSPDGTVIALNGPWGSGKSSAVNLVLHHLKDVTEKGDLAVVNFACWWFRGEDALALAFFRELYAGIGQTLGDKFKKALHNMGVRLLKAGSIVSAGADLVGAKAGVGTLASSAMSWVSDFIKADDTVEKLQGELTKALAEQNKRFLIVIDDIDRLAPDEALLVFRLVKSVGRLPNVVYLLVFDRELAEAIVSERYPSEGPHYLEKIIQAGFDVPRPRHVDLTNELLRQIELICGSPREDAIVRFMNVFYDVIAPEITTPRDLIRIANVLSVTWPAVGSEVDCADFVGLEVMRLFQPSVYRNLRSSKEKLCGTGDRTGRSGRDRAGEMNALFLDIVPEKDREHVKRSLMRLFPGLESVWGNLSYGDGAAATWSRDRLVCSEDHFDSYFRFSIGDDVLSRTELDELISKASDEIFVKSSMRAALGVKRRDGSTKAKLILDELNLHAARVEKKDVGPLLKALFEIADELDVEADRERGFSIGDNELRIHWLLRSLTRGRFDLATRSKLFAAACRTASLSWLVDFAQSAYTDYHPREGKAPSAEADCLTTEPDAEALHALALKRIRAASRSSELASSKRLAYLMFRWRELAADEGQQVKRWAKKQLKDDAMVAIFAKAFTSHSWTQGAGDAVARRHTVASVGSLDKVLDRDQLRRRVEEIAAEGATDDAAIAVMDFLTAWKKKDADNDH
ncbi:P-loop NTPase fold protein [Rhodoplanes sp. TEM]|uniref:P-loop NTPase fold protein n=1 Tax=Rhodoplanes tepidamans TaxID=200616 RepID=A0ABT5JCK5_RHOTP|nr:MULTISPECIES: P-loop NTPase fold protein [Rhodoplanes]MDC7787352.1 P-loop NTPase fold protein [Rhodoplanes tepidamans]MDC7984766.1 P-loop NTPase fold protein [Rhodoplanes sp. TEM]MDQ0358263.1 putative KAP-like P-loop ATPase [Rhodoplanes tepidamans]